MEEEVYNKVKNRIIYGHYQLRRINNNMNQTNNKIREEWKKR
jgi:hypothetical protein